MSTPLKPRDRRCTVEGWAGPSQFTCKPGRSRAQERPEAYQEVEEIRGVAGAKAPEIYASAYNRSPEAVAFYEFTRTMQSYKAMIAENTTLVLSTDSDLFKFLKGRTPDGVVVPGDGQAIATQIQESDSKP